MGFRRARRSLSSPRVWKPKAGCRTCLSICVERVKQREFSLEEVYVFEGYLQAKYPGNGNVRAEIRQQLQILRDKGLVRFVGRGRYRVLDSVAGL